MKIIYPLKGLIKTKTSNCTKNKITEQYKRNYLIPRHDPKSYDNNEYLVSDSVLSRHSSHVTHYKFNTPDSLSLLSL